MIYGRATHGRKLHIMIGARSMCGVKAVETTAQPLDFEDRCGNCDNDWRELGRLTKPAPAPPTDSRTIYKPRFTFARDWELRP